MQTRDYIVTYAQYPENVRQQLGVWKLFQGRMMKEYVVGLC